MPASFHPCTLLARSRYNCPCCVFQFRDGWQQIIFENLSRNVQVVEIIIQLVEINRVVLVVLQKSHAWFCEQTDDDKLSRLVFGAVTHR